MKQKKKQKKKISLLQKTSYIGVLTFVIAGLISLLSIRYTSRVILPSENSLTVTLPPSPTPYPVATAMPPEPSKEPTPPVLQEAAPVFNQPEPFQIVRPSDGDIIKPFSTDTLLYSKTMSDWRTHTGIDFSAVVTKNVVAAADGTVENVYADPLMGYTIVILHQDDFRSIYQNLSSIDSVSAGDTVVQGQAIAEAGSSASAELLDVPHLHFALTQNNELVNPLDYFATDN